ncbi:uncharacterized protein SAMN02745945_02369 [Peptoclostridium litorale DSM 5388]|uniref:Transcription accessory protein n=1 Tax=Peptoclostridium litorale DSM 5388 TaxID=1121324 RepID=A0A069RBE5_PEPLI|nr:Tex family protein [Peptoclostridium litorale]KDR94366.1 transcription accessory protein [Peptoclostridium litorale DSM 5388]SIO25078.1 uncharacterized protein SAMN02745945_02369 [Peptoclostridium litorale DSM 5388]
MDLIKVLQDEFEISKGQVENTVKLIDEGNTIPFIARYRKEMTGGLSDIVLRQFGERLSYIKNLEGRKEEVIRLIGEQGKLDENLKDKIIRANTLQKVEDFYRPFRQKKSTRASKAKERGLEPLADAIMDGREDIESYAMSFINAENEVGSAQDAIQGAKDIIAEVISDKPEYREWIRKASMREGILSSRAANSEEKSVYENYYEYEEPVSKVADHRILAINRGEKEKFLKIKVLMPDDKALEYIKKGEAIEGKVFQQVEDAIEDAYKRLIQPSIEREIRSSLTERAQENAIEIFAKNMSPLIMAPPVRGVRVLAIDPSFRTGCKLAVLDETGKLLEYATIYPNEPKNETQKSKEVLLKLIQKYDIDIIPIGNGTASRETESFVAESIKEIEKKVCYTIVSEAGASVYSASKLASEEYPDVDVSIRGAISIGRRLQDPMAELVKIDPKSIGVGQYQHDLNQKRLDETLAGVVEDCVNAVGVDLNTATVSLLKYIAGISESIAKNIVAYREENGKFNSRKQLKKVKRLGGKTFEQCAGFLRICDGENPLDNTSVHPESYEAAASLLGMIGMSIGDMDRKTLDAVDIENTAKELGVGEMTLRDIIDELKKPGRDIRDEMPKPIFKSDVLKLEDLKEEMILSGTVRNVVDFGAFVDIGVKNDGLVHISQISNRFIKHPMEVLSVGDVVSVKVISVDLERGKVSLSIKQAK